MPPLLWLSSAPLRSMLTLPSWLEIAPSRLLSRVPPLRLTPFQPESRPFWLFRSAAFTVS
ncbi:hypothetical protein D3C74_503250 [compost metagenome]